MFVRTVLVVLSLAAAAIIWTFVAWPYNHYMANADADAEITRITAAITAAAQDGSLTRDEVRAAGAYGPFRREGGTLEVVANANINRFFWSPFLYGHAIADRQATYVVTGTEVRATVRTGLGGVPDEEPI